MNEQKSLPTFLQSSVDSTTVANRIKGAVLATSSIIIFGAALLFHIHLTATDIVTLASELGAVGGAIWTLYGSILWLLTLLGK